MAGSKAQNVNELEDDGTLDAVAAMLVGESPTSGVDDEDDDTLPDDIETDDEGDDLGEDISDTSDEEGDDEDEDTDDSDLGEDDEEDDETEILDIYDTDILTVTVDDEEQEVSIGDLKKSYSHDGAAAKRLQEATETRNQALAFQTAGLELLQQQESALTEALTGLDDNLFKEVIPAPDESLRNSNPTQYLQHKELFDQDQQRIADARKTIEDQLKAIQDRRQERLTAYGQEAAKKIAEEIPELADKDRTVSQGMYNKLKATALVYGYSEQEIQAAIDPRMYMLVRDAMKYRDLVSQKGGKKVTDTKSQKAKRVRVLKSGSTTARVRARAADKARLADKKQAAKSGKVDDIAKLIVGN